jgi:hypothetical protein
LLQKYFKKNIKKYFEVKRRFYNFVSNRKAMKRNAKVDANQKHIVDALRAAGAYVLHTHQLKNAFDILVGFRGKTYVMEIKNPEKLKKAYSYEDLEKSLTDGERKCKDEFAAVGVTYHIVASVEEALFIIQNT